MRKTKLIVLGGFAGAGKTTLARKLASEFNFPILSSDDFNQDLRLSLGEDFHEVGSTAYDLMWHILKKQLQNKVSSILDSNMCRQESWNGLDSIKQEYPEVEVLPIILVCSLDVHRERITKRGKVEKDHLNLGGDKLEDVLYKYDFISRLNRPDLIKIDANGSVEDVYKKVVELIW